MYIYYAIVETSWTTIERLSIIWKLSDQTKRHFFQTEAVLVLVHGLYTLDSKEKHREKLDEKHLRLLRIVLNKSWEEHSSKQQLYEYFTPSHKPFEGDEEEIFEK